MVFGNWYVESFHTSTSLSTGGTILQYSTMTLNGFGAISD